MAEHIWSVLSNKAVIDNQTNSLSLFDVLEQLTLSGPGPEEYEEGTEVVIPANFSLTTLWRRSDLKKPEKVKAQVSLVTPDNEIPYSSEVEIDLLNHKRRRAILNFQGFPLRGPGTYRYRVDIEGEKGKGKVWRKVVAIPLEVVFDLSPEK